MYTFSPHGGYLLGKILQEGKGVSVDIPLALKYYHSVSAAYPDANYRIGYIYESSLNGHKNWSTAKIFYQRAADKGHELAAKRLTWSYSMFGSNTVPDDATLSKTETNNCLIM
jgi:TPR repeat protein